MSPPPSPEPPCLLRRFTLLLPSLLLLVPFSSASAPPYLSPATFAPSYRNMLESFRIFIYSSGKAVNLKSPAEALFHAELLNSSFVTGDPEEADLFFVPVDSDPSTRSLSRVIRDLRSELPYWNRTLGADHFYVSCSGIGFEGDRNLLELKKNSVHISCFPAPEGKFVPHKDITLPPIGTFSANPLKKSVDDSVKYLGFVKHGAMKVPEIANDLVKDSDFLMEQEPSNQETYAERMSGSKFCLFDFGGDVSWIGDAMRVGCVPVVITHRPIQDLPLIDVLKWQDMAVFVGRGNGGVTKLKQVLGSISEDNYAKMQDSGISASTHFTWNDPPQPMDSFHLVMYQLWLRRHTIRYARSKWA